MRSKIEANEYKDYILGFIFYKFLSDKEVEYLKKNDWEDANLSELVEEDTDIVEQCKKNIGYFISYENLFSTWLKKGKDFDVSNITDALSAFDRLIDSTHRKVFDKIFDTLQTGLSKLGETSGARTKAISDLLGLIKDIPMDERQGYDVLGFIYEYLISNYASNAGKSGGEFFTPQTVSKLLARLVMDGKTNINKVYDPTCGSGSLLLQMKKQFDEHIIDEGFFGQEINMTNFNLARMNMFLHNVNYNNFSIKRGDTLINPLHRDEKPFDAIVSNPPYSIKWVGDANPTLINDERFAPAGKLAPKSYADYAFIMHSLAYLSSKGRAAIVCFPGIFYRKGAEKTVRQYLVDNNFIDCVIQLPENLFFGTSIATCILVMAKNKTENKVLFIDASKEFKKETNNNILEERNIRVIVDEFRNRTEKEYFSRYVDKAEIVENDYNLSVSTYVEKENTREIIDIKVLNKKIEETVKEINELRASINEIVKELEDE